MSKAKPRIYSLYTKKALALLGNLICSARKEQKITANELAERTGVSRSLIQRIEKGNPKCEIGVVFETASILKINLFNSDFTALNDNIQHTTEKLSLLPKTVRKPKNKIDDDF